MKPLPYCMLPLSVAARRLKPLWFSMLCTWPSFSFLLGPCRIFSFPQLSKFHNDFPMWESVYIYCTGQSVCSFSLLNVLLLASVFLSRTPIMWVLYFLDQSSNFLLFFSPVFRLFIVCSLLGQFLQLQFPTCLLGLQFCYCFKFPLFIYK